MSEKHQIFIESMISLSKVSPDFVEPLKSITKCYVINEGIVDWFKKFASKAKTALTADPTKEPTAPEVALSQNDKMLLRADNETFANDYRQFHNALSDLNRYLSQFGDTEYINYVMSPTFDKAIRRGGYIDAIRRKAGMPNPVMEALDRAIRFCAVLEGISSMGYPSLAKSVYDSYAITEGQMGIPTGMLFVSKFNDPKTLVEMAHTADEKATEQKANYELNNRIMPTIARFIAKHGKLAWNKFLNSSNYKMAKRYAEIIRRNGIYGGI